MPPHLPVLRFEGDYQRWTVLRSILAFCCNAAGCCSGSADPEKRSQPQPDGWREKTSAVPVVLVCHVASTRLPFSTTLHSQ